MAQSRAPHPEANGTMEDFFSVCLCVNKYMCDGAHIRINILYVCMHGACLNLYAWNAARMCTCVCACVCACAAHNGMVEGWLED